MTDTGIPALIERLHKAIAWMSDMSKPAPVPPSTAMQEAIDVISRLTASPLPDEVAGLLALKEGLPDGPWEARGRITGWWVVWDRHECVVAPNLTEKVSRAIAALPKLFVALEFFARHNPRLADSEAFEDRDWASLHQCAIDLLARAEKAEAAVQQQAREIERLNVILGNHGVTQLEKTEIMLAQKARIRDA